MAPEQDGSGWTIYGVMDVSLTLETVVTVAGAYTIVIIMKTFPLDAIKAFLLTVSDVYILLLPYFGYFLRPHFKIPCRISGAESACNQGQFGHNVGSDDTTTVSNMMRPRHRSLQATVSIQGGPTNWHSFCTP